ncbi:MAG: type VI secretion system baseplate subunit TssK [Pseudomonadota bacterium]
MELSKQREYAVQWHEGMLLSPHHFQQEQAHREIEQLHVLSLTSPYFWGMYSLDFEPSGILKGALKIRSVYGIMPDGLVVKYNENDHKGSVLEVDLNEVAELQQGGGVATVHLVVPIRTENAAYQRAAIQRFDSLPGSVVVDENTGENGVEVHRLSPRYGLEVGELPPSRYVSMPLMRIKRESDETFRVTDYVPPVRLFRCQGVPSADALGKEFEEKVFEIRQKAVQLAGIAASNSSGLARQERVKKKNTSAALGAVLPKLELVLSAETQPFTAYAAFCDAVGYLARLTDDPVPPRLPAYDHNDIRAGFDVIYQYISNLLDSIKAQFSLLPFDFNKDKFSIDLSKSKPGTILTIEIRAKVGQSEDVLREFVGSARIVSESMYKSVSKGRLLGAEREILETTLFKATDGQERIVLHVPVSDRNINLGERLIISSAGNIASNAYPESVWLYSSHMSRS